VSARFCLMACEGRKPGVGGGYRVCNDGYSTSVAGAAYRLVCCRSVRHCRIACLMQASGLTGADSDMASVYIMSVEDSTVSAALRWHRLCGEVRGSQAKVLHMQWTSVVSVPLLTTGPRLSPYPP